MAIMYYTLAITGNEPAGQVTAQMHEPSALRIPVPLTVAAAGAAAAGLLVIVWPRKSPIAVSNTFRALANRFCRSGAPGASLVWTTVKLMTSTC